MNFKNIGNYKFIEFNYGNVHICFSTGEGNLDFNKNSQKGLQNLNNIKKWFDVESVSYLNQIHSNKIFVGDDNIYNGDALISNEIGRAIGVFTADCVPILILDKKNKVIGAVHSGWRSTAQDIVMKTIKKMKEVYHSKEEFLNVYIGPHIKKCCFEVGEEVIDIFKDKENFKYSMINNKKIDLQSFIIESLINGGVNYENIFTVDLCTYCCNEVKLHSYRKEVKGYGRMFSFIYMK